MAYTLIERHLQTKPDIEHTLKSGYNILFYGYGCKKALLSKLFTQENAIIFDGNLDSSDHLKSLLIDFSEKELPIKNFYSELNNQLKKSKSIIYLIIINFCFEKFSFLCNFSQFKIIGTVEKVNFLFSKLEIETFNFIFRDLTTYVPYNYKELIKKENNFLKICENVFYNVQKQSKIVFINLLYLIQKSKAVTLLQLFLVMKSKLGLRSKMQCKELLIEFIDHKIIGINNKEVFITKLTKSNVAELLENYKEIDLFLKKTI